ncbi:hypothetical protein DIPPA_14967 [Diplonema papillatum]|nr:hypothetical protein DIPPA_14967 [Diplonema papillatum]
MVPLAERPKTSNPSAQRTQPPCPSHTEARRTSLVLWAEEAPKDLPVLRPSTSNPAADQTPDCHERHSPSAVKEQEGVLWSTTGHVAVARPHTANPQLQGSGVPCALNHGKHSEENALGQVLWSSNGDNVSADIIARPKAWNRQHDERSDRAIDPPTLGNGEVLWSSEGHNVSADIIARPKAYNRQHDERSVCAIDPPGLGNGEVLWSSEGDNVSPGILARPKACNRQHEDPRNYAADRLGSGTGDVLWSPTNAGPPRPGSLDTGPPATGASTQVSCILSDTADYTPSVSSHETPDTPSQLHSLTCTRNTLPNTPMSPGSDGATRKKYESRTSRVGSCSSVNDRRERRSVVEDGSGGGGERERPPATECDEHAGDDEQVGGRELQSSVTERDAGDEQTAGVEKHGNIARERSSMTECNDHTGNGEPVSNSRHVTERDAGDEQTAGGEKHGNSARERPSPTERNGHTGFDEPGGSREPPSCSVAERDARDGDNGRTLDADREGPEGQASAAAPVAAGVEQGFGRGTAGPSGRPTRPKSAGVHSRGAIGAALASRPDTAPLRRKASGSLLRQEPHGYAAVGTAFCTGSSFEQSARGTFDRLAGEDCPPGLVFKSDFIKYYAALEHFGAPHNAETLVAPHNTSGAATLTYEEFSLIMLRWSSR